MGRRRDIQSPVPARKRAPEDLMPVEKTVVKSLRLTVALDNAILEAVRRSGLTYQEWIRAVLARAANEGAFAPTKRTPRKR
jgi:uncharacterized protein (DUF4415 family)